MIRIENLTKVPLFSGLTPVALDLISRVANEENHALGTKIFQQGDIGDKLYIILEGKVRISRDVPGMGEEARSERGDFGDGAPAGGHPGVPVLGGLQLLLSSDAKRNTPGRFAIALVDQDLRECWHARLFASAG